MLLQAQGVEDLLENNPDGLYQALEAVLRVLTRDTAGPVLDAGWALYWSLAVILTVWTGLKWAGSGGGFGVWEVWRLVVALIVPLTMLGAYDQPLMLTAGIPIALPGSTAPLTFPELVTAQGTWLAQVINADGMRSFHEFTNSLGTKVWDAVTLTEADGTSGWNPLNWPAMLNSLMFAGATLFWVLLCFFVALLASMIGFAQVLFAQVAIAICVVLGPVLIPWILLQPMAFLFWGWFRVLLTYGLYAAVSAAVFRVMLALLQGTTDRVLNAIDVGALVSMSTAERSAAGAEANTWLLVLLACSLAAIVSFLKIPALAAGLVSGQAGGESIGAALGAMAAAAVTAGKGAAMLAKGAGGAAAGAARR